MRHVCDMHISWSGCCTACQLCSIGLSSLVTRPNMTVPASVHYTIGSLQDADVTLGVISRSCPGGAVVSLGLAAGRINYIEEDHRYGQSGDRESCVLSARDRFVTSARRLFSIPYISLYLILLHFIPSHPTSSTSHYYSARPPETLPPSLY